MNVLLSTLLRKWCSPWWSRPELRCWLAKPGRSRTGWLGWGNPWARGSPARWRSRWRSGSGSPWTGRGGRRRPAARRSPTSERRCGRSGRPRGPYRRPCWRWTSWTPSSRFLRARWSPPRVSPSPGSPQGGRHLRPHPGRTSGSRRQC